MINTHSNLPPDAEPLLIQTCRTQHQVWATTIAADKQEIDQLLTILTDLPTPRHYRSLHHSAVDYADTLNLLKGDFQRLQGCMVCDRAACTAPQQLLCASPRLGLYTTLAVNSHLLALTDEFDRIRERYYQFLSFMVTLNMI